MKGSKRTSISYCSLSIDRDMMTVVEDEKEEEVKISRSQGYYIQYLHLVTKG